MPCLGFEHRHFGWQSSTLTVVTYCAIKEELTNDLAETISQWGICLSREYTSAGNIPQPGIYLSRRVRQNTISRCAKFSAGIIDLPKPGLYLSGEYDSAGNMYQPGNIPQPEIYLSRECTSASICISREYSSAGYMSQPEMHVCLKLYRLSRASYMRKRCKRNK